MERTPFEHMTSIVNHAVSDTSSQLQVIGKGPYSKAWSKKFQRPIDGNIPSIVLTCENGNPLRSLKSDYRFHTSITKAMQQHEAQRYMFSFAVPAMYGFLTASSSFWNKLLPLLPATYEACNAFFSEKIPEISLVTRQEVVRLSYRLDKLPVENIPVGNRPQNYNHIRPYLGWRIRKNTGEDGRASQTFNTQHRSTLRNFPLKIDQMEVMGLPMKEYARAMASALAFLHWHVRVDAKGIEFVLAGPRPRYLSSKLPQSRQFQCDSLERHSMWLLGFDSCQELTMDEKGVEKAARSFWQNDPYYPSPCAREREDRELWDIFEEEFLAASEKILKEETADIRELPKRLMEKIRVTRTIPAS